MANVLDIVRRNPVALRRLLDGLGRAIGVPLFLFNPALIPECKIANISDDCIVGLRELAQLPDVRPPDSLASMEPAPWWVHFYQTHGDKLLPSGRSFDHPFLTLLRDIPFWYWWELITYKKAIATLKDNQDTSQDGVLHEIFFGRFPGGVEEFLVYGFFYTKMLDSYIVVGPAPLRCHDNHIVSDFCADLAAALEGVWKDQKGNQPRHPALRRRPLSIERLERVYHDGGHFSEAKFQASAKEAETALRCALRTELTASQYVALPHEIDDLIAELGHCGRQIASVNAASLAAAFGVRLDRSVTCLKINSFASGCHPEIRSMLQSAIMAFGLPESDQWLLSWRSDIARRTPGFAIDEFTPYLQPIRFASVPQERLSTVLAAKVTGEHADILMPVLDQLICDIGDRTTQDMLQNLFVGRAWLNDRFAQLSGMTDVARAAEMSDGALAEGNELRRNADGICRWLVNLFNADFVTIYQRLPSADPSKLGPLKAFGTACRRNDLARNWAASDAKSMIDAGNNPQIRYQSACYRALWSLRVEEVPNNNGLPSASGMLGPPDWLGDQTRPRAGVAVPIKIFGRPWGVFELVGLTQYQFVGTDHYWFEEVAELIGQPLYNTWMLSQIYQVNHAVLFRDAPRSYSERGRKETGEVKVLQKSGEESEYHRYTRLMDNICEIIARVFIADGAALWIEDSGWPGRFELVGLFGIKDDPHRHSPESDRPKGWHPPRFSRDDMTSLSNRAIAAAMEEIDSVLADEVFQEPIECRPAEPIPGQKDYERAVYHLRQWESHVRHVAIIPLLIPSATTGRQKTAIGTIALFSKDRCIHLRDLSDQVGRNMIVVHPLHFPNSWVPLMDFAGSQTAMLIKTIHYETHRKGEIERQFSHEILKSVQRIRSQFRYIDRWVLQPLLSPFGPNTQDALEKKISIGKAIRRVFYESEISIDRINRMRRDHYGFDSVGNYRTFSEKEESPVSIRALISDAFDSNFDVREKRRLPLPIYEGSAIDRHLRLSRFSRADILNLLENLADNATKYCSPDKPISVDADVVLKQLEIRVANYGDALTEEEEVRLYHPGFRGNAAKRSGQGGAGYGLYIAKQLAGQIGIDLHYAAQSVPGSSEVVHIFTLLIDGKEIM